MIAEAAAAFDRIAGRYGELWSETAIGRAQREAAWRWIDLLFPPGSCILDLGCGIGDDALHLAGLGVEVCGVDGSSEMTRIARSRGVNAQCLAAEDLGSLHGSFHGAISNFGALNCVPHLQPVARELSRLIAPGGFLAIGLLGKFCLWETTRYLLRGEVRKACRRFSPSSTAPSLGLTVYYPGMAALIRDFKPHFRLVRWTGIGLAIPPSGVTLSDSLIRRLSALDCLVAHRRFFRALADHRLVLFRRI